MCVCVCEIDDWLTLSDVSLIVKVMRNHCQLTELFVEIIDVLDRRTFSTFDPFSKIEFE
jgi:hypothetical protein